RARALREDIARLRVKLGIVSAAIARHSEAAVRDPQPGKSAALTARVPAPQQAVIEYWLGAAHAYAWVIRHTTVDGIELAAGDVIPRAARALHGSMHASVGTTEREEAATALYRLVLAPLKSTLSAVQELVVVPDGALHYVPFGALRDPA